MAKTPQQIMVTPDVATNKPLDQLCIGIIRTLAMGAVQTAYSGHPSAPTKQHTHSVHGKPLGKGEIRGTKEKYGWPVDAQFLVPDEALEHMRKAVRGDKKSEKEWDGQFDAYAKANVALAKQWRSMQSVELPAGWDKDIPRFPADAKGVAWRAPSDKALNAVATYTDRSLLCGVRMYSALRG